MSNRILIVDFGSQFTQLIARRIREFGVYSQIVPYQVVKKTLADSDWNGIILSGGPSSVIDENAPIAPEEIFLSGLPLLGICYGQQTMVSELGGAVNVSSNREFGRAVMKVTNSCELFNGVWVTGTSEQVWMSHGDTVISIPKGFRVVGTSEGAEFAAIADDKRHYYGLQFHPEVIHTPNGKALLSNFTHKIAGCSSDWTMNKFLDDKVTLLKETIRDKNVICGVSGGVDSTVVAALLNKSIGDQLTCIFVDNGMLRNKEVEYVINLFRDYNKIKLVHVDAKFDFLKALEKITDPEQKRKIIGKTFIEVFEKEANKIGNVSFLAQGTLYPDVIESISPAGGPSATIKSHHNVGGLPEKMNLDLIEPLKELFKDEVRQLGRELKLSEEFIERHPFPGPGLAIRIPGEISSKKLEILRAADEIYLDELHSEDLYKDIWQAFAVLLPVKTVGVMGDDRTYEFVCALRAVTSLDGMTADVYPFNQEFLVRVANKIVNKVPGINRVVYDITSKPPATIEWE